MTLLVSVYVLYVYLLDLSSTYERKHAAFFWTWLISLNIMSSSFIHLPLCYMVLFFLMDE
jgi:membrane protein insertase Oxa1/YidC/SpoIIIJ